MEAESVLPEDKDAILALLQAEVLNTHTTVHSLAEVEAIIYRGLEAARRRERKRPALVDQLYAALNACARSWSSDSIPQQSRLEAARDAFQVLISEHFAAESAAAKELKAAADGKVELQLWQLMRFLVAQLQRTRDEPLWCQELTHFATAAQRAYATQYSARYLDSLLKAAGTFDDMKVLRNFVNSQTRTRIGQAHNTPEA
ncbi:uncharacterized protein HaLaN_02796, partial [Haematococcus lacustris]